MTTPFADCIRVVDPAFARFDSLRTLQVNLGNRCNLACRHCHVGASPAGTQAMGPGVMAKIVRFLARRPDVALDITGGAPELNPHFRHFISATEPLTSRRILRSNLAVMAEPGLEWLPEYCREQRLVIIASLPCYLEENVDRQRGTGVFARSIAVLRRLNDLGYGCDLELILVYNPADGVLPGNEEELEAAYRRELRSRYGISFTSLYALANVPLGRFCADLQHRGEYFLYLHHLTSNFNPEALARLMCRTLVSVDWLGRLYNCDFNQAAGIPLRGPDGAVLTIDELEEASAKGNPLRFASHCYACAAGSGSGCSGATVPRQRKPSHDKMTTCPS